MNLDTLTPPVAFSRGMTEIAARPNQLCIPIRNRRLPAFRWLAALIALMITGSTLVCFGWEQWQLFRSQSAAPVFSIAPNGRVFVNGHEIVIGPDGLPPKVLEEVGGGPPKDVLVLDEQEWEKRLEAPRWARAWSYPRRGFFLYITRRVEGGAVEYQGRLTLGPATLPCTVELRGQRLWLGEPGPRGDATRGQFLGIATKGDYVNAKHDGWILRSEGAQVWPAYKRAYPLSWLKFEFLARFSLTGALLNLPPVPGGMQAEKMAAFKAGDPGRGW